MQLGHRAVPCQFCSRARTGDIPTCSYVNSAATHSGVTAIFPRVHSLSTVRRPLPEKRNAIVGQGHHLAAGLRVMALDAAQPFDFESRMQHQLDQGKLLKIGIVGFGTFGRFLAKRLVQAGHQVLATSRTDYHAQANELGVAFFQDANDFCEEHPEVVILATSILSLESVLAALPVQRLRRNTLFVDVLSVKEFPKRLLLSALPPEVDILCTHPMFGPDSGKDSWQGLNFMYEKVRIQDTPERLARVDAFIQFFDKEGCNLVEMACEEHDRHAASTQFITHTVGRVLGEMNLKATPVDTRGFQSLLSLVDNTSHDSFALYYGLFMYNQSATEELGRLEAAFDSVKRQLLESLHEVLRNQIFEHPAAGGAAVNPPAGYGSSANGNAKAANGTVNRANGISKRGSLVPSSLRQ